MKRSRSLRGEVDALTPTLSRLRERGKGSLSPVIGGEGWGEGGRKAALLNFIINQVGA
jgi:hypothetical protein